MKTSSYTSNKKEERGLSIVNKRAFKLPTTLPKRITALQQSLNSSTTNTVNTSTTTSPSSSLVSPYVLSVANTMKLRMKAAVNTMLWNGNRRNTQVSSVVSPPTATETVTTTPMPLCDLQQKQLFELPPKNTTLKNGALLKQYLTFVQEETGAILDLDLSIPSTSTNDSYQPSFEIEQNHQSHSLASSGAALIESMVHHSQFDSDNLPGELSTTTVTSTNHVTPPRRISRPIKSASVAVALKMEEEETQIKKSERLQFKQRQKSRLTPLETTMISSKNKNEPTPPSDSTTAVIRCICATPHEEFGAMVQCDDCACWLHLECLALDVNALDETFRCPSCSVTLGYGQQLTSAVTWRVAAQLKSQHLANRCNTTAETTTTYNDNIDCNSRHQHHRRKYNRQRLQGDIHPPHRHHRSQQRKQQYQNEKRRQFQQHRRPLLSTTPDEMDSSSSDSDDNTDEQQQYHHQQQQEQQEQHHNTWMIPKMTIHSSISTTMTTSTGNVLVQRLNNRRTPSITTIGQNGIGNNNNNNNNNNGADMDVDSDTTESDWESGDRYQRYQRHRSSIDAADDQDNDYYSQESMPGSAPTQTSLTSINTTPSLTLSPSHTGSDAESPCEASTPPSEHFGHDDTYIQAMNNNINSNRNRTNNTTATLTNSDVGPRMILSTTATSACLDQESLIWLSRLAYLESLQSSTQQQCFNPHASDVFLCGDQQQQQQQHKYNPTNPSTISQETNGNNDTIDHHNYSQLTRVPLVAATTVPRSDPPSTICSHDLSQFSFDTGPFWSPIR